MRVSTNIYLIYCSNDVLVNGSQDWVLFCEFRVKVCCLFLAFLKDTIIEDMYNPRDNHSYNFWFKGRFDPSLLQVFPLDVPKERVVFDCLLASVVL